MSPRPNTPLMGKPRAALRSACKPSTMTGILVRFSATASVMPRCVLGAVSSAIITK